MHLPPLAVLLVWIPAAAFLFRRFPVRVAILVNFFAGWAILPGAQYTPTTELFPYWILGVCLPSAYFFTKATVIGLSAVAGMLLVRSADWRLWRPSLADLPMLLWCCAPLLSTHAHLNLLPRGLFGAAYHLLAWGIPWMLGRIYFSDRASLLLFAKSCVFAGLCYVPVCLVEWISGPRIYVWFYGYQPYRLIGADRYFGYRPIGLLEDGNQLGIWMAAAALLAIALAYHRLADRVWRIPMAWAAILLVGATLLCQSVGSIILLICLLPFVLLRHRAIVYIALVVVVLGIAAFAVFLAIPHTSLRAIAASSGLVRHVGGALQSIGRHSLVWRLTRDESHLAVAMRHPLLGSGEWNWWRTGDTRPWSLWLLVFGMYGAVGVIALGALFFLPLLHSARIKRPASETVSRFLLRALAALILLNAFDALLNGDLILVYLLAMGGLSSWNPGSWTQVNPVVARKTPHLPRR
jgi:hypothetical protein